MKGKIQTAMQEIDNFTCILPNKIILLHLSNVCINLIDIYVRPSKTSYWELTRVRCIVCTLHRAEQGDFAQKKKTYSSACLGNVRTYLQKAL